MKNAFTYDSSGTTTNRINYNIPQSVFQSLPFRNIRIGIRLKQFWQEHVKHRVCLRKKDKYSAPTTVLNLLTRDGNIPRAIAHHAEHTKMVVFSHSGLSTMDTRSSHARSGFRNHRGHALLTYLSDIKLIVRERRGTERERGLSGNCGGKEFVRHGPDDAGDGELGVGTASWSMVLREGVVPS